jgi:hypothetical protein
MRIVWQSALSVILGFIGGVVAMNTNFHFNRPAPEIRGETIRATRFELVDSSNSPLAYWGKADQGRSIQIAFLDDQGAIRAKFGVQASQLVTGRPVAFSPFSEFIGSEGKVRLAQRLDGAQNPVLAMGDSKGENRLLLGRWNSQDFVGTGEVDRWEKWSLVFRDSSHGLRDYVDMGVTTLSGTDQRTGYAVLRNSQDRQLSIEPKGKQ